MASSFIQRVAGILHRYSMTPEDARLGVATSGGADSVVLLHVLLELGWRPTVLHANHKLRGAESEGDETFVRDLAGSLGLPVIAEACPVPDSGNLEQEARDARRVFFQTARAALGLTYIALGHTESDQAETVLYRFLRGSGTGGLAAMRPVTRDGFIRPLLQVSREEVRAWAREKGLTWREDSSNFEPHFVRNRLRNELLPRLAEAVNPGLTGVLAQTAAVAQDEEDYWTELAGTSYAAIAKRTSLGSFLPIEAFRTLHPALQRRIVRCGFLDIRGHLRGIDLQHVEAVRRLTFSSEAHDRVIVPGVDALRSFDVLLLARPGRLNEAKRHYRVEVAFDRRIQLPYDLGAIRLSRLDPKLQNCVNVKIDKTPSTEIAYLNSDALRGPIYVRNWEPGDGMRRPGHSSFEKLKTLFQEHRILLWERRHWPVLVSGDEVIWAKDFGCSAEAKAEVGTERAIQLEYAVSGPEPESKFKL